MNILVGVLLMAAGPGTASSVVARHLEACGGAARLRAVSSVREVGTITVHDPDRSSTGPALTEEKRPNQSRSERTVHGVRTVWAYDGSTAWIQRDGGRPEVLTGGAAEDLARNEFDHFLLDYEKRGIQVELVGITRVETGPAHKLKVTLPRGGVRYTYIDTSSFLEVKREYVEADGTVSPQWFRAHRVFAGLTRPTVFEMSYPGGGRRVVVTIDRIDINPSLDEARFRIPGPP